MCPEQIRCHTEATLVSEGGVDLATLAAWPPKMQKYRQQLLINGTSVEGLRDTGASVTMVTEKLVSPGQYLAGQTYPVTNADNQTKVHPMAMVTLEWGGVNGLKQVAVSSNIPVDCLLGNDLESSAWAEVELKTHAAMLGIPELVCVKTRAQCKAQGEKVELESGKRAQATKRKGKTTGKPAATQQQKESLSSQEEVLPSEGTEPMELEPYQVELLGPGGPSREQLCKGQETCPSLEGLRQQAAEESNGKKTGTHRVYWSTTAPAAANALIGIFTRVGFPKEVVSDRGTNFMSAYLKHMWNECGVTYKFTTPYHPQTNGLAGGGCRPPVGIRLNTAPRSIDREGYSDFPAGPAGDLIQITRRPSGKAPSTRKPARNRAGGVEGVRRVQQHPSRFSVSASQTLKSLVGQRPPGAPRPPLPPTCSWRLSRHEQDGGRGGQNPLGGAASCAALEDSKGQWKTGGRPPVFPF
ncbi:hypothetical protein NDU88_003393 [Pleurodeles waltl]|uniref:Integrase catalytic domain-containing protein n=1 Tax=Pleurodeles waltl TaxID=8319 RepID=A0AAV7WSN2_PLEWA|nr:hypothetical protein NDU88_003393 [Pleurodeles waltl]